MQTTRLVGYPGISVATGPEVNPFFQCMVTESLSRLNALTSGAALLKAIAKASPSIVGNGVDGFSTGSNVTILPISGRVTFVRRGVVPDFIETGNIKTDNINYAQWHKSWSSAEGALARTKGDVAHIGGNSHTSMDGTAAGDGTGTVAKVHFSNSIRSLSSGLDAPPFIGLGHELIHALHSLEGEKKSSTDEEESRTVGIKRYSKEVISENVLRRDAGLTKRSNY